MAWAQGSLVQKLGVLAWGLLYSVSGVCEPLGLVEITDCTYVNWRNQLRGGLVDAEAAASLARTVYFPSVSASIGGGRSFPAPQGTPVLGDGTVSLSQTLVDVARWVGIRARDVSTRATEHELEDQLLGLTRASAQSYYEYHALREQEALQRSRAERLEKILNLLKAVSRLRISEADPLSIETDRANVDVQLAQLSVEAEARARALQVATGIPAEALEMEKRRAESFPEDPGFWSERADHLPAATAMAARASALELDQLSISGRVTFPLFDQGARFIRAGQFGQQREILEARPAQRKRELSNEIRILRSRLRADELSLQLLDRRLELARSSYQEAWKAFSQAKGSLLMLQNADDDLINTEIQRSLAEQRINVGRSALWLLSRYERGRRAGEAACRLAYGLSSVRDAGASVE